MTKRVVTAVDAQVDPAREVELLDGYRRLTQEDHPDGLVRTELLREQEGAWRIQTTWESLEAVLAVRAAGKPPAAVALLDEIGAQHSHGWFLVEAAFEGR